MTIPLEVWGLIESHVLPNPYSYTAWSHVCRGSRAIFHSDAVWLKFTPVEDVAPGDCAGSFYRRMAALSPELKEKYSLVWRELEVAQEFDVVEFDEDTNLRSLLFRSQYFDPQVLATPDLWLVGRCWGHMMCPSWLPPEVFVDRGSHAEFIQKFGVSNRAIDLAIARLYGVHIRYMSDASLDDEQIVLAAARSRFTRNADCQRQSWMERWKHIPQVWHVSKRLRKMPHIVEAYVSRWPCLASELGEAEESGEEEEGCPART